MWFCFQDIQKVLAGLELGCKHGRFSDASHQVQGHGDVSFRICLAGLWEKGVLTPA
jgi:hypothetical protein